MPTHYAAANPRNATLPPIPTRNFHGGDEDREMVQAERQHTSLAWWN